MSRNQIVTFLAIITRKRNHVPASGKSQDLDVVNVNVAANNQIVNKVTCHSTDDFHIGMSKKERYARKRPRREDVRVC